MTLALALGLGALVAVAAVDALRGSPEPRAADTKPTATRPERPPSPADWVEDGPAIAASLARLGVTGTLYLSADGCLSGADEPLDAVGLPDLTLSEGPNGRELRVLTLLRRPAFRRQGRGLEPGRARPRRRDGRGRRADRRRLPSPVGASGPGAGV